MTFICNISTASVYNKIWIMTKWHRTEPYQGGRSQKSSAELLYGCPDPGEGRKKKTHTKEQNSLAASLRTCSSFSWSEYSLSIAAAEAHAQMGTQQSYKRR